MKEPVFTEDDRAWMQKALVLAEQAEVAGEVPVGAVIVRDGKLIGEGFNQPITTCDPTSHAELVALRHACKQEKNYRLPGATLYVTLEPCSMCAGALVHARIQDVVFAAKEPKSGALVSTQEFFLSPQLNHRVLCRHGLEADTAGDMLSQFFKRRRDEKKRQKQHQKQHQKH
ncbi:tRNA-specific adenosine deaminase [Gammaproteobacteria bacterium 42_54_T18]|nr:tRNA-specific adenosine deaminase [Gammaproteobacteria bacterium 42_54_T18]